MLIDLLQADDDATALIANMRRYAQIRRWWDEHGFSGLDACLTRDAFREAHLADGTFPGDCQLRARKRIPGLCSWDGQSNV